MGLSLTLDGQPVVGFSNLQVKSIARGGFASVTFDLPRKLDKSLLESFTNVQVFDPRTAEQVGGGRLMEQGRNDDGTWAITCLGEGLASMQDRTTTYFAVDGQEDNWRRWSRTTSRLEAAVSTYPGYNESVLYMSTTEDKTMAVGSVVQMLNRTGQLCNQPIGAVSFEHKSGVTQANWRVRLRMLPDSLSGGVVPVDAGWNTTLSSRQVLTVNGDFPSATRVAAVFEWERVTSTILTTEDHWSAVRDPKIQSQLLDRTRSLRTTGYNGEWVYQSSVFTDLVARYCPRLDIENATVETSAHQFDQIAYIDDGISPMGVMEDLLEIEPTFVWQVWGRNDTGRWDTEFKSLPTFVRYEADVRDGFSSPSPTVEVYNRVTVVGKTAAGRSVNVVRTSVVPDLDAAGIIREATIDLGTEVWSTANANKRGDSFLAEHAVPPNAGTLTVARSIRDNLTGRFVRPQHIRSGELVRVAGVQPNPDTLNAAGSDGQTVFRIVSSPYDDDSGTAALELDSLTLSESRALQKLLRSRTRK